MKKTSNQSRALSTHFDIMDEFLGNLSELFPDCQETKDAHLYCQNVCKGDQKLMREAVDAWCENMREPLQKGCAKYMRAIESITGEPACVYHAFAYRDLKAIDASSTSPTLKRINLTDKLRSDVFTPELLATCWEYVDELNKTAYEAIDSQSQWAKPPTVPTRAQIQEDIARRKGAPSIPSSQSQDMSATIADAVRKVFDAHGATITPELDDEALATALHTAASAAVGKDDTVAGLCRAKDASGFDRLRATAFPGSEWDGNPLDEREWDELNKALSLVTMKASIPQPMMSGIEQVANKIAQDMANGTIDLATLNVEEIGQQVLSNVSASEMEEFANNIDKIVPALDTMKPL